MTVFPAGEVGFLLALGLMGFVLAGWCVLMLTGLAGSIGKGD